MAQQGDEGAATEMKARERQGSGKADGGKKKRPGRGKKADER